MANNNYDNPNLSRKDNPNEFELNRYLREKEEIDEIKMYIQNLIRGISEQDATFIAHKIKDKFFISDLRDNLADEIIMNWAKYLKSKRNSVEPNSEEIPLKTKRIHLSKDTLVEIATVASVILFAVSLIPGKYKEHRINKASENIETVETFIAPDYYKFNGSFVGFNSWAVSVRSILLKDPSLFNVVVYNEYFSISENRLDTFCYEWRVLQQLTDNLEEDLPNGLFIKDISFLRYILDLLVENGEIDFRSEEYTKIKASVEEYDKGNKKFLDLLISDQDNIYKLINKYKKFGEVFYKDSYEKLANLADDLTEAHNLDGKGR